MAAALDLSEFATVSKEEKIELIFRYFDVDEDGWLNKDEFKAMLKGTNPAQTDDFTDAMVAGTIIQLSKQAIFRGHAHASKGLDLDGLIISYTKLPGNDVDKDGVALGWVTQEEVAKTATA